MFESYRTRFYMFVFSICVCLVFTSGIITQDYIILVLRSRNRLFLAGARAALKRAAPASPVLLTNLVNFLE